MVCDQNMGTQRGTAGEEGDHWPLVTIIQYSTVQTVQYSGALRGRRGATGHDNTLNYVITDTSTLCLVCAD